MKNELDPNMRRVSLPNIALRSGETLVTKVVRPLRRHGGTFVKLFVSPARESVGQLRSEAWRAFTILGLHLPQGWIFPTVNQQPDGPPYTVAALVNDMGLKERSVRELLATLEQSNLVRRVVFENRGRGGGKVVRIAINPDYMFNGREDEREKAFDQWHQLEER